MRILYLSQYFHPEVGATQSRALEMASHLATGGHRVCLIAEFPNHPSGIMPPSYRGRIYERDAVQGIEVIRVWVKASPVKNLRSRLAFYISYMVNATLAGLLIARGRFDLIYATSPPLFTGAAGLALSRLRRVPLIFEVRDLWPEAAVVLGELADRRAIALAEKLEMACYRGARHIVLTSQEMKHHLAERGIPDRKMTVIPNGANVDLFHYDPQGRERIRHDLGLAGRFVVIYAGLMGIAQGLPSVLEAVRLTQDVAPNVHWLFVGDGPVKEELVRLAKQAGLANLTFLPAQAREEIPAYLSAGDAALIPLVRNHPVGQLPVKLFDAMACERPVLLSAGGEALLVLEQAQAGVSVEPESPQALVEALLGLMGDSARARLVGLRGREFVVRHFSREAQARQLEQLLTTLTSNLGAQADVV
jgi:colanic acid biosynthesis glycosyl transferase WcaI